MSVASIPLPVTWALYAVGSTRGPRNPRPRDARAAWLIEREPSLSPGITPGSVLAAMRVRHDLVDAAVAGCLAPRTQVVTLGGTVDLRWADLADRCESWTMRTSGAVLKLLEQHIPPSAWASAWQGVQRVELDPTQWGSGVAPGTVVVAEGLSSMLSPDAVQDCLARLREVQGVRVIIDLPGYTSDDTRRPSGCVRTRWLWSRAPGESALGTHRLHEAGWVVESDHWQAGRPDIRGPGGAVFAPGVEPMRVLQIRPR